MSNQKYVFYDNMLENDKIWYKLIENDNIR
jgi:hypothetical protein